MELGSFTLTYPLIITTRLMPGVKIGDATLSVYPDGYRADDMGTRLVWRYFIDGPGVPGNGYEDADLRSAVLSGQELSGELAREAVSALLSFLSADAESYGHHMGSGEPEDGYSFGPAMAEWAYQHSDEISLTQCELDERAE